MNTEIIRLIEVMHGRQLHDEVGGFRMVRLLRFKRFPWLARWEGVVLRVGHGRRGLCDSTSQSPSFRRSHVGLERCCAALLLGRDGSGASATRTLSGGPGDGARGAGTGRGTLQMYRSPRVSRLPLSYRIERYFAGGYLRTYGRAEREQQHNSGCGTGSQPTHERQYGSPVLGSVPSQSTKYSKSPCFLRSPRISLMAYHSSSSGGGLGDGLGDGLVDQVEDRGLSVRRRLDMKASGSGCCEAGEKEDVELRGCDVKVAVWPRRCKTRFPGAGWTRLREPIAGAS